MGRYIVGIDLGTTNSAITYVDIEAIEEGGQPRSSIKILEIPQFTAPGEISNLEILPSFLYLPGDHELPKGSMNLPWDSQLENIAGTFAREHGAKVPKRMVSSAKSWLCHPRVDREAPILPWGSDETVNKVSPITAISSYLTHITEAWNHSVDRIEEHLLENQTVIITVPASFDEVARDLTVKAASMAGLKNITLIEEPLAAFYSWLSLHEKEWEEFITPGELILVCDVGGGTTDFTLITLKNKDGNPVFERIAVGDHLILGGDNMDLALARRSEVRLKGSQKAPMKMDRWQALCHQCRAAKEEILIGTTDSKTITLVGGGRKLIADTVTTTVSKEEVEETILDGFFPPVSPDDTLTEIPRQGMTEFGLPYAQDAAITRHLIRFLEQHTEDIAHAIEGHDIKPDLILFNGAALKPMNVQGRISNAIEKRFQQKEGLPPTRVLTNTELDLAVALGASYYGLVKKGRGVRVDSGSARAFFLQVHLEGNGEKQNLSDATKEELAICLVERGMPEGTTNELSGRKFSVLANQPVTFNLYSSSFRSGDAVGDVITVDDSITPLPPLHTVIKFGKKAKERSLPVQIEAHYTEMGTLALSCRSMASPHRWKFQFQLREKARNISVADEEVLDQQLIDQAIDMVQQAFTKQSAETSPPGLVKKIGKTVSLPKEKWPLGFIRVLGDELQPLATERKRGIDHESRWLNLTGFCLRPGFGDALDEHRVKTLWKIHHNGPLHTKNVQVRSEWWVLWRRVAGGLSSSEQRLLSQDISSLLKSSKKGKSQKIAPQEHLEAWMCVANLERISVADKTAWGNLLMKTLQGKKVRAQYWWSLSRIGSREPLYGPVDLVVDPRKATNWIEKILKKDWPDPKPVGLAIAQIARLTGDRKRDLDPAIVEQVIAWLTPHDWAPPLIQTLREVRPMEETEKNLIFGESLPSGIRMRVE
jgi:molecular chaperone DnaK (HSP70)